MQEIGLRLFKRGADGQPWKLQVDDAQWRLLDHTGKVVAQFSPEEATRRVVLPSFFSLIPGGALQVHFMPPLNPLWAGLSPNRFRLFHPDREAVAAIGALLDRQLALQDPVAVRKQRSRGEIKTLVGSLGSVASILFCIGVAIAFLRDEPIRDVWMPGAFALVASTWLWGSGRREAKQADRVLAAMNSAAEVRHVHDTQQGSQQLEH